MAEIKMIYEQPEMQYLMLEKIDVITVSGEAEGSITTNNGTFDEVFDGF